MVRQFFKTYGKRVGSIILAGVFIVQAVYSVISVAHGDSSYNMLGTNEALGSPVLSNNFEYEDWNKWEMLCWGIFLSNFCTPLVDDYQSAFDQGATTGSKGSGLQALQFGSGSDATNSETIQSLVRYATDRQQSVGLQPIYVQYNNVVGNSIELDTNTPARQATLKDLFYGSSPKDGDTWVKVSEDKSNVIKDDPYAVDGIASIGAGRLPLFSVKSGNSYETVFNFANSWDAQIMTAWFGRALCGDYKDDFSKQLSDIWKDMAGNGGDKYKLGLDCFGNICISINKTNRVIIPASANQYLTKTHKINLVNSLIFNQLTEGADEKTLVQEGQQALTGVFDIDWLKSTTLGVSAQYGGLPALGSYKSNIDTGSIYIYYDTDSLRYKNFFKGGDLSNGQQKSVPVAQSFDNNTGDVTNQWTNINDINYGAAVKKLFDMDITSNSAEEYPFKLEVAGLDNIKLKDLFSDKASKDNKSLRMALSNLILTSGEIANVAGGDDKATILTSLKTTNGDLPLFNSKATVVPVAMDLGMEKGKENASGMARNYINYLYKVYSSGSSIAYSSNANINKSNIESILSASNTADNFKSNILGTNGTGAHQITDVLAGFLTDSDNNNNITFNIDKTQLSGATYSGDNIFEKLDSAKVGDTNAMNPKYDTSKNDLDGINGRLIKLYPISDSMRQIGDDLGVRSGTEFGLYSTYIYLTYLDWYGVKLNRMKNTTDSEFNPKIFTGNEDILKVDITQVVSAMSKEDKEKSVLDYTYLMLNPTLGREYRASVATSAFSDFLYNTYEKMVYGNASTYYSSTYSNVATRNATGFLNVEPYSQNFMTAWFIKLYAKIVVGLLGVSFAFIIILGLLKGRKFSWFLVAMLIVINTVLLVPSFGELIPASLNTMVQSMFSSKMTYWAMAESISNQKTESDYISSTGNSADAAKVAQMEKSLKSAYLDRALMVKQDISTKVTQTQTNNFAEIQQLQSARWLLPMVMQQFSASDSSANYVYTSLGNMYDNMSNMYWLYNKSDAAATQTINAQSNTTSSTSSNTSSTSSNNSSSSSSSTSGMDAATRTQYYPDYKNTTAYDDPTVDYRSEAYSLHKSDISSMSHTYFYLLTDVSNLLSRSSGFKGNEVNSNSFKDYLNSTLGSVGLTPGQTNSSAGGIYSDFNNAATNIENVAGTYDSSNKNSVQPCFGYLWATESPYHYFYESIKDCFRSDESLGALIGSLQGQYVKNDSGEEVRTNFMYANKTGKIKDVADLEEMFTNEIPYLYEMQIASGGFDGKSGVLGSNKIQNYDIYKDNNESWLFRSNWVTKLMESSDYNTSSKVKDKDGNESTVANQMLAECYPANRPMVFSEAQEYAEGLTDDKLTLVELKCVQVNKAIAKRWTLLLNYVGSDGLTNEILYRQMTTDAVDEFDTEFSPKGLTSAAYKLYPDGIDLRAISFDSVMKMLMLNVTKNTSYVYNDTMKSVMDSSDLFTAVLLLIAAFLCTYIIPFARNIVLGLIFYLGFLAIIYALFESTMQKAKTSCGYLISNIIFLVVTLAYYACFSIIMAVTTSDSVLTVQSVQVNVGNPVWCFIVVIIISLLYIWAMGKMINFCFKHYRDMGFEVYAQLASAVTDKISNGMANLGAKLSGHEASMSSSSMNHKSIHNNSNSSNSSNVNQTEYSKNIDKNYNGNANDNDTESEESSEYSFVNNNQHGYSSQDRDEQSSAYRDSNATDNSDAESIDREIEKGKRQHGNTSESHNDDSGDRQRPHTSEPSSRKHEED